jgi:trigger factor
LKIETQALEDHQIKLVVEVEPQPFEQAKRRAAGRLSRQTKIPGFRPGKAPYHIVQRHIGEEAILDESLEILLKDLYPQIIDEAEIEPHGPGKLANILSIDPLKLEFLVPLAAEVELGDYQSIRHPYEPAEVGEDDIEDVLQDLRQRQAIEEPTDRAAQEGDHVFVRISAERAIAEEGEQSTLIAERPHSVIIETDEQEDEDEWPFPGFSRQLIGMSADDEKSLTHSFSEDSDFESLRGVTAQFTVKLEDVRTRTLPVVDDDFAQSIGEYETVEDLRADIRESLDRQRQDQYDEDYDEKVLSDIIEDATIKYPPQMLDEEIDEVIHQLEHSLQSQNLDLATYLMTREMSEDDLREEVRPVAETRLKRSLVLLEISEQEDIEIPPEEVQAEAERALEVLSRTMTDEDLQKISVQDLVPNLVSNIMVDMKINRTLERLRALASEGKAVEPAPEEEKIPVGAAEQIELAAEEVEGTGTDGDLAVPAIPDEPEPADETLADEENEEVHEVMEPEGPETE